MRKHYKFVIIHLRLVGTTLASILVLLGSLAATGNFILNYLNYCDHNPTTQLCYRCPPILPPGKRC